MSRADGTATISSPSNSNSCDTLSGGSAAFILIALALGTLAQPPDSLVIPPRVGHRRIWRLSPFLCGLEGLTILFFLIQARFVHISQRTRTFTIMAKRTTTTHDDTRPLVEYVERPKLELIVPMMLQIWKVIFIRGPWSTTTMAILYCFDWATVQYCHCWIYFRPITEKKSHCQRAIQHAHEERSVCKRDWAIRGEASDYVDVLTRVWGTHWNLRLLLDVLTVLSLGAFLLRRLANLIPFTILATLLIFY
jgi:hypothetical protein